LFMNQYGVYLLVFNLLDLLTITYNNTNNTNTNNKNTNSNKKNVSYSIDENTLSYKHAMRYIENWLRTINIYALGAPVFIIGTHLDKFSFNQQHQICQLIDNNLNMKFASLFPKLWYYIVSSPGYNILWSIANENRNELNISKLRNTITNSILNDPCKYIETPLPISWLKTFDKLKEISTESPFLYLHDIIPIANSYQVFSTNTNINNNHNMQIISSMLQKFHEMGVLLYFHTSNLNNVVFLNPQWLIDKVSYY